MPAIGVAYILAASRNSRAGALLRVFVALLSVFAELLRAIAELPRVIAVPIRVNTERI